MNSGQLSKESNLRTVDLTLSRQNIVDQVATLLYVVGVVKDSEEVQNIQFGELFGVSDTELVPIKVFIKSNNREVLH